MSVLKMSYAESVPCERQANFVHERLLSSEEQISNICAAFDDYTNKAAKMRDACDNVASVLHDFCSSETICKSIKEGILDVVNALYVVGDYRTLHAEQMESRVVKELCQYEVIIRNAKNELKNIVSAKDKEISRRRALTKVKAQSPQSTQKIIKAQTELAKAAAQVSCMQRALEDNIETFEIRRGVGLKSVLKEFIKIDLSFHAKALECLTDAYTFMEKVDNEQDLEEFKSILKMPLQAQRREVIKKAVLRNINPVRALTSGNELEEENGVDSNIEEDQQNHPSLSEEIEKLTLEASQDNSLDSSEDEN